MQLLCCDVITQQSLNLLPDKTDFSSILMLNTSMVARMGHRQVCQSTLSVSKKTIPEIKADIYSVLVVETCEQIIRISTCNLKAATHVYNQTLFLIITYLVALLLSVLQALYVTCSKLLIVRVSQFAQKQREFAWIKKASCLLLDLANMYEQHCCITFGIGLWPASHLCTQGTYSCRH